MVYHIVIIVFDLLLMTSTDVASAQVTIDWFMIWEQYGLIFVTICFIYILFCIRRYYKTRIELLRLRIARDIHDDISSTLNSISFFADAIESKELNKTDRKRFSKLISDSSREAKEKISDIIWVIHPQNDDWENLLLKCKRYASDVLECKGVSHQFFVDGCPPSKLSIQLKKNTWLIFRELITNIAKHANPNHVEIRFQVVNRSINLIINDDGRGFDPGAKVKEGYGLNNIKSRVESLKGRVFLDSNYESGTHWNLQLPI